MELTIFYTFVSLVIGIILSKISYSSAKPTFIADSHSPYVYSSYGVPVERVNRNRDYILSYGQPLTSERLSRLRRGYYYVDDGFIAPVSNDVANSAVATNNRRQDASVAATSSSTNNADGTRYSPIVRYQETRTKRKKLFVPNLFG